MLPMPPPDLSRGSTLPGPGWTIALPLLLAAAAGAGTLWLAPPAVGRVVVALLLAAAAGLAAAALLAALAATAELRRRDRERRRELAAAAWREEASRDDSLDGDGLCGGTPDPDGLDGDRPDRDRLDRDGRDHDGLDRDGLEDGLEDGSGVAARPDAGRRVLLDAMSDAAVLLAPEGWVVAANRAALAALGAAAAPDSRWDGTAAWPAPLVAERRELPDGGALIVGRDPLLDRLRGAQTDGLDAMTTLAGAIVHDVNNAFGAVAGYADFLVTDLPADTPQADYAARILTAVDRGKTLLRQILAGARGAPPEFRPVAAGHVLGEAASLLRVSLPPEASLSVREEPELPAFPGDAASLARALAAAGAEIRGAAEARLGLRATLWSGALDAAAAPPGWRVALPLAPRLQPHAMFELRSGGAPRPMAELLAAFDPLLSARAAARRQEDGPPPPTALTVARWHDGGLTVWTHPGEGTVVRLFVPLPESRDFPAAPAEPADPAARCHVLVVDDDPAMGDWLSDSLERLGCEVAVCESAGEALEIVMDEPTSFDVALAGPTAGEMSGAALIIRLKALRPDLCCVLCGGAADGDGEGGGGEPVPADLFLPRPMDAAALARVAATFRPATERP